MKRHLSSPPGNSTTIALSIKQCGDNKNEDNTTSCTLKLDKDVEYTVVVVDQAALELSPYELQDIAKEFRFNLVSSINPLSSSQYFYAPEVLTALLEKFIRQQEEDPRDCIYNYVSLGYLT